MESIWLRRMIECKLAGARIWSANPPRWPVFQICLPQPPVSIRHVVAQFLPIRWNRCSPTRVISAKVETIGAYVNGYRARMDGLSRIRGGSRGSLIDRGVKTRVGLIYLDKGALVWFTTLSQPSIIWACPFLRRIFRGSYVRRISKLGKKADGIVYL